ncbi:MAG: DNA polymerase [Ferrovibrio sp.]|uniref:DNA polymerase n=1 Tax=Ferrovibrio sp. TaxID=1917215 RepID=UPI00391DF250
MSRYIFDIETNGLLDELDRVHCLVLRDIDTGDVFSCAGPAGYDDDTYYHIEHGLDLLQDAELIVGHNIIKFDIPALQKVYPGFQPKGVVRDTIVLSRLIWPDTKEKDYRLRERGKLPGKLIGRHSLEAWGYRLGEYKGDFKGPWDHWTPEMQSYCEQDVEVTTKLWQLIQRKQPSEESVNLEHEVAAIIFRQEQRGFAFDLAKAASLYSDLCGRRSELETDLQRAFRPWFAPGKQFVPKRDNKKQGYVAGCAFTKIELRSFNPGSRDHIANRLQKLRGWKPKEFTADGKPKVDETVLEALPYPEAKLLTEYLMVQKRIGQLAEGDEAWLKRERNGRLHGEVVTNGAHTGRMTHRRPNMAQVPSNDAPYGKRCRELFMASTGLRLVGCDADALELRCLAAYMARYDGGAYIDTVLKGKKAEGTDMHTLNAKALGCDRDTAKVWFYAFIYGAGDKKLGYILGAKNDREAAKLGKASRARFLKALPALGRLTDLVQKKLQKRGYLVGLDGRHLHARSPNAALNTLLQSAGAVLMKRALVILDQTLQSAHGFVPGVDYEFVANVHDEWQIEVRPEIATVVGEVAAKSITLAGEYYGFRCPLAGNFDIGACWADTH